jgi:hypothetical protein
MNYISANINLEDYVGKHINVDMDGVRKKFNVVSLDDTVVYPSSAILLNNEYSILGLSTVQDCPSCSATFVVWDAVQERFATMGNILNLFVTTRGSSESLNYQWYRNNTPIDGATSSLYTLPPFDPTFNGNTFKVGITGLCNTATSENKVWLGTNQYFATACDIAPDNLFYFDFKEAVFHYNTLYGDLVNGDWFNYTWKYIFVNGVIFSRTPTCIDNPYPPINIDISIPETTPPPEPSTTCTPFYYDFYNTCFPTEGDASFQLKLCDGLWYDTPYGEEDLFTGTGYKNQYKYVFADGVQQSAPELCTTTTTPAPECCSVYGYEVTPNPAWGDSYEEISVSCAEGFGMKICVREVTTPPPPECCSVYGYSPTIDPAWGGSFEDIVVSCAEGFGTKTCYREVTTTPKPYATCSDFGQSSDPFLSCGEGDALETITVSVVGEQYANNGASLTCYHCAPTSTTEGPTSTTEGPTSTTEEPTTTTTTSTSTTEEPTTTTTEEPTTTTTTTTTTTEEPTTTTEEPTTTPFPP